MKIKSNIFSGFLTGIVLCLFLSSVHFTCMAQSSKANKLKEDIRKIEKEIEYTNKLLEETKQNKKTTLSQVLLLKSQIEKREKLIGQYNNEIDNLSSDIDNNQQTIGQLQKTVGMLKDEYAKMVYYAFKNRSSYSRLMFILSSESFNQAYQRIKYFQQYSTYRKKQIDLIHLTEQQLGVKIDELQKKKTEKEVILQSKEKEKTKLTKEKNEQDNNVKQLKKKEKDLLSTIKKKQREADKLQSEIQKIIAEEIRKSKEKFSKNVPAPPDNKTATNKVPENKNVISLTPEETIISNNFANNRGALPWPTEKGVISSSFGEHPHPVHKDIKIRNNGVNILTNKGSYARSIFNGVITAVIPTPDGKKAVIIRHGEFLSVYSNLESVIVKRNDKISLKQKIGLIYGEPEDKTAELHFEIWKNTTTLNPALWIAGN